jgi:hypothetical protein
MPNFTNDQLFLKSAGVILDKIENQNIKGLKELRSQLDLVIMNSHNNSKIAK